MLLQRLSIQSKLIVVLLLVSLSAVAAITYASFRTAKAAAELAAQRQMTSVRSTKANLIQVMLGNYKGQVTSFATSRTALESLKAFREALKELDEKPDAGINAQVQGYYKDTYIPGLAKRMGLALELGRVVPAEEGARKLQAAYLLGNTEAIGDEKAGYSKAHSQFHFIYDQIAKRVGIADILLIDGAGERVVYEYRKTPLLGTSLVNGPYANTTLAASVRTMLGTADRTMVSMADFENFRPYQGEPAAFLATPIFDGAAPAGVVAFHVPMDEIVRVMTSNHNWKSEGLGDTGEVYLVGPDNLMRSQSRFIIENPKLAIEQFRKSSMPTRVTDQIARQGSVVLSLPVNNESARLALAGESGVHEVADYRGEQVVSAYAPLDFENVRWGVLAEMDTAEAYAAIAELRNRALATATGLSILVSLLAMAAASFLTRPIRALTAAARRVSQGDYSTEVKVDTADELRELGDAFNQMTAALREKTERLETTLRENEDLLLNILPAPVAARLRDGEEHPSETFNDVTVIYATLGGLESAPGEKEALVWLHQLVVAFDDAADVRGVEKLKTMGASYLAASGLTVPRPDHPQRAVEFAEEMVRIVGLFNREHGTNLEVDIGINAGPVTGGVVGRKKFIYDLWGETVALARFLQADGMSQIQVTQPIYDRLRDQYTFEARADVPAANGRRVRVYRMAPAEVGDQRAIA